MRRPVLTVRPATLDDAFDVAEIQIDGWRTTYRGLMPDSVLLNLDLLTSAAHWEAQVRQRRMRIDVVLEGQRIIGFAAHGASRDTDVQTQSEELYALYVARESQRLGAGTALIAGVLQGARERGAKALTVWVVEGNRGALGFYAKHGLLPDGSTKLERELTDSPIAEVRCALSLNAL